MDKEALKIGDLVSGKVSEDMEAPFKGTVEKIYENSVLLAITEFEAIDKTNVSELNNKIVVNLSKIELVTK